MFHHPFQESQDYVLSNEELFMDMELCSTKKELDSLFLYDEPTSVLDLGDHISPLNSPCSDASNTIFSTTDFSSEDPWQYDGMSFDGFDLDVLSPTSTSSSDLSLQEQIDDASNSLNMLEDLLLSDDDHDVRSLKTLQEVQQDQAHAAVDSSEVQEGEQGPRSDEEKRGLDIVHLLLACVEKIQAGDPETSKLILHHLASSVCNHPLHLASPIERVSTHISRALTERINKASSRSLFNASATTTRIITSEEAEDLAFARRAFYQHFPFAKFAHFTANQAILESFRGYSKLHIVDLDIDQGLQWPSLIQALSQIPEERAPSLRITGVGPSLEELHKTGHRLTDFATSIGYNKLDYHLVHLESPHQLDPSAFFLQDHSDDDHQDHALAVNCSMFLHRLLGNQSALERTLATIKSWRPTMVTVSEVEANHNTPSFVDRFVEALHFYSAVFDCLESGLDRTDSERMCIESAMFGEEIREILACEGAERMVRHAKSESWRDWMRWSGFKDAGLSDHSLYQAHVFLTLYSQAFRLTRDGETLTLGWHDTPIVSVSTWSC